MDKLKFVECNHVQDLESLSGTQKRRFDVLTHQSHSYFTKEHEIHVPVGLGDKVLPPLPRMKRMRFKSGVRRMFVSRVEAPSQDNHVFAVQAPSQDNNAGPSGASAVAVVDADMDFDSDVDSLDLILDSMTTPVECSGGASRQDRYRVNQLKAHSQAYTHFAATSVMLQDMPITPDSD